MDNEHMEIVTQRMIAGMLPAAAAATPRRPRADRLRPK